MSEECRQVVEQCSIFVTFLSKTKTPITCPRNSAVAIPHCDAVYENAFNSPTVKVQQDVGGQVSFPLFPKELKALSCLFVQYGGIEGTGKILREMDTKELEARHALHSSPINVDGSVCGPS